MTDEQLVERHVANFSSTLAEVMLGVAAARRPSAVSAATAASVRTVATTETVRVGQWMSPSELQKMRSTGLVQESFTGTTKVAYPADITTYGRQASRGDVYVEFDVTAGSVRQTSNGVATVVGPNSIYGRLAARQGNPIESMPTYGGLQVYGSRE